MDDNVERSNLLAVSKEPGVSDLPIRVRAKFAHALLAERNGDNVSAEEYLNEAIEIESEKNK